MQKFTSIIIWCNTVCNNNDVMMISCWYGYWSGMASVIFTVATWVVILCLLLCQVHGNVTTFALVFLHHIQTNKYYNQQQLQSTTIHNVLWRSSQSMFGCTDIDIYSTRFSRVVSVGLISTKPHPPTTYLMLGTSEGVIDTVLTNLSMHAHFVLS